MRTYDVRLNTNEVQRVEGVSGTSISSSGCLTFHKDNVPIKMYRSDWWVEVTLVVPQPEEPVDPEAGA